MQPLDHTAVAAGEFEQPAGERPDDAENGKRGCVTAVSRPAKPHRKILIRRSRACRIA